MYKCGECGKTFYEPNIINTTFESYYDVTSYFGSRHPLKLYVCPFCEDENIEEIKREDEEL